MLEIELKMKVKDLSLIRERLLLHHATLLNKKHERDVYYNAPHRDFGQTDEAVRVRYTNDHAVVTYKGPKIKKFGLKAREELNFAVECGKTFETMLDRLGFTKTLEVNKWRETYKLGTASVSLDIVDGLGTFAEIEVMTESESDNPTALIEKIAQEIGVVGEPILASYLEMLLDKQSGKKD